MPSQFQLPKANEFMSTRSVIRIVVVWLIGLAILRLDYQSDFDLRFQTRSDRSIAKDIVIIELSPSDLRHFNSTEVLDLLLLNSSSEISDHYYWSPQLWNSLLSDLLKFQPRSVIITLDLLTHAMNDELNPNLLSNRKINWLFSKETESIGLPMVPLFEKRKFLEVLNIESEKDGLVRKVNPSLDPLKAKYINFQGSENRFFKISYNNLINNQWPIDFFKNKTIIIGGFTNSDSEYITPAGIYRRTTLVAQLVENKLNFQWIKNLNFWTQSIVLLFLIVFMYFITIRLSRNTSLTLATGLAFVFLILNIFLFDYYYFWFPIISASICLFLSWFTAYTVVADDIEKKNFKLEQESEARKKLELMKTNFISLISHDLKNPLAKIQSVVQRNLASYPLMKKNSALFSSESIESDLLSIQKYSEELDHYIRSMLNIARVEAQDVKLNLVPSDINQILDSTIASVSPLAEDKKIAIKTEFAPLFLIELDPILIKEALINILENAIKYSPEYSTISIKTFEQQSFTVVEVIDFGMGISSEDLKQVGQKFFRSQTIPDSIKGSGLGLFLVKYFVELHSGTMSVTSALNKGTTVTLSLPNR